jgi:hypothetical protein
MGQTLGQNGFDKAVLWLVISALSAMACGKPPKPLGPPLERDDRKRAAGLSRPSRPSSTWYWR